MSFNFIKNMLHFNIGLLFVLLLSFSFTGISFYLYQNQYLASVQQEEEALYNFYLSFYDALQQEIQNYLQPLRTYQKSKLLILAIDKWQETGNIELQYIIQQEIDNMAQYYQNKTINLIDTTGHLLFSNHLQDQSSIIFNTSSILSKIPFSPQPQYNIEKDAPYIWQDIYLPLYHKEKNNSPIAFLTIKINLENIIRQIIQIMDKSNHYAIGVLFTEENNLLKTIMLDNNTKPIINTLNIEKKIAYKTLEKISFQSSHNAIFGFFQPITKNLKWGLFIYKIPAKKDYLPFSFAQITASLWIILSVLSIAVFIFLIYRQNIQRNLENKKIEDIKYITSAIPGAVYQLKFTLEGEPQLLFLSEGAAQLYGLPIEQIKRFTWNIFDFIVPEDNQKFHTSLRNASHSISHWQVDFRIHTLNGVTKFIQNNAIPTLQKNGDILWNGILIDITKQQWIETALKDSEARFKDLVAAIPDIIYHFYFRLNGEQGFYYISSQCKEIFGASPEELKSYWNPNDYFSSHDAKTLNKKFRTLFNNKIKLLRFEGKLHSKNGKTLWFRAQSRIIRTSKYEVQLFGVLSDITYYRKLKQSLLQAKKLAESANSAKSEFVSRMSHELRTPLNTILGFSQLILTDEQNPLPSHQQEGLQQIDKAGWYLLELINEVLDLSSIEAGKIGLQMELIELKDIMQECYRMIKPVAQKRNIAIQIQLTDENNTQTSVMADKVRLRQAILNLLSNAIKYNRENGLVEFYYHPIAEQKIRIIVKDYGIGISQENIKKLFKPFNRLGQEFTNKEGAGIGLVITKRIIELMAGSIGVESQAGQGSTFWLDLPLVDAKEIEHQINPLYDQKLIQLPKDLEYRILYFEDQIESVTLLQALFARYPQICLTHIADPRVGLEAAQNFEVDVIILDLKLPNMNGFEVIQHLKNNSQTANIPIIILSAEAMPAYITKAKQLGCSAYLTKPINLSELQKTILSILQKQVSSSDNNK